jgi:ABC-2 type transport system ATP-binding protein
MPSMIQVKNLVKIYSDGTRAIDQASFDVEEGEIYGFLGPNGAGKSTTIKVLTTILKPTEGTMTIAGHDVVNDAGAIRKLIGVQSQETIVDGDLTGRDNLLLQGHLQRMRGRELDDRADELLRLMGLSEVADKKAMFYSSGMKKRLDMATVMVHRPKLLFLDEPTVGLDPQSRGKIWAYLQKINREEGVTVLLSTQYLEEADRLCRRVSIIDQGRIVVTGSPQELKQQVGGDRVSVGIPALDGEVQKAAVIASGIPGVSQVQAMDGGLALIAKDGTRIIPEIVRALDGRGIVPLSVNLRSPTLDDVFLQRTGKSIRLEPLSKSRKKRRMPFH